MCAENASDVETPGQRLRRLRLAKKLTVKQLAELVGGGVHFTTISKLERGTMAMSWEWAERIMPALNATQFEIFSDQFSSDRARMVPLYWYYDWTPECETRTLTKRGWVPTVAHGENLFGLGFLPSGVEPELGDSNLTSVIDPDRRVLQEGVVYAIFVADGNLGTALGRYQSEPPGFDLVDGGGQLVFGDVPMQVIGTVVFQCRSFWWS